ncbi:hypothetical protein IFM89_030222 [Coptis chinensis]|uniref:Uncharacterized protein n=1 Tax=Coptis chinensis TaxID=261450 RepID=A0A835HPJ2_9MAGN|nr:hypothetical protein IFM89_030222 [Coptis chinensis]
MDQCLQISDNGLFDKIESTHKESGGNHVEHNFMLKDPPRKKNKDHKYDRIKHALEKKKRTAKAQRNSRNGKRGPNTERNKDDYAMADDGLHEVVVHTEVAQHGHPPDSNTEGISGVSNMTAYFVPYHTSQESIAHTTQATTQATLQVEMDTFQFDHLSIFDIQAVFMIDGEEEIMVPSRRNGMIDGEEEEGLFDEVFEEFDTETPSHLCPLAEAAHSGNLTALTNAFDNLSGSIDEPLEDGDTAFHLTCLYGGFSEIAQLLINAASNSDCLKRMLGTVDVEGDTPLHHAARGEHVDVVRILLAAGASPLKPNIYGKIPAKLSDPHMELSLAMDLEEVVHSEDEVVHSEDEVVHSEDEVVHFEDEVVHYEDETPISTEVERRGATVMHCLSGDWDDIIIRVHFDGKGELCSFCLSSFTKCLWHVPAHVESDLVQARSSNDALVPC